MCGRFASVLPPEAMRSVFRTLNPLINHPPSWNVAPTQRAMAVRRHPESGERHLDLLQWGFIPFTTKDLKTARKPINARAETAAGSGMFRAALARRRCLIPVDAFYEWRDEPGGKQPYAVARRDGAPAALAGIWESWRAPDGEVIRSFAILTTAANATMAALHQRMPVVVEASDWPVWLGEADGAAAALLRTADDRVLDVWPVGRAVNSVRNDDATLLDRVERTGEPRSG